MKQNTNPSTPSDNQPNDKGDNGINCSLCLYCDSCDHNQPCEYLAPIDDDDYVNKLMEDLRSHTAPSPSHRLGAGSADRNTNGDETETWYYFYRGLINDCLDDIRKGRIAYVYRPEHLAEILRFEPGIHAVHKDGVFYISL